MGKAGYVRLSSLIALPILLRKNHSTHPKIIISKSKWNTEDKLVLSGRSNYKPLLSCLPLVRKLALANQDNDNTWPGEGR